MEKHSIFQKIDDPSSNIDDFNTTLHYFNTKGTVPSDLPDNYLKNTLTTSYIANSFMNYTSLPKVEHLKSIPENGINEFLLDPLSKSNSYTSWTLESSKTLTEKKHQLQIKDFANKNSFPDWGIQWDNLIGPEQIRRELGFKNMNIRERIYNNEYIKWKEPCKRSGATITVIENFFLRTIFFKDFLEEYEELMDELERTNSNFENIENDKLSTSNQSDKDQSINDITQNSETSSNGSGLSTPRENYESKGVYTPKFQQKKKENELPQTLKNQRKWKFSFCVPKESKKIYREYMLCLFGGVDENGNSLNDCWIFDTLTGFWKEIYFNPQEKVNDFESIFSSTREYHQYHFDASDKVKREMNPFIAEKLRLKKNKTLITNNVRELSFFKKTVDESNGNEKFNRFHKLKMTDKSLKPLARSGHSMINISETDIFLFGGKRTETFEFFNDIWILTLRFNGSIKWKMMSPKGVSPCPRWNFSICLYNKRIYIFGGETINNEYLNDIVCYDIDLNAWIALKSSFSTPSPRMMHGSCIINEYYFIIGGFNESGNTKNVWSYDIQSTKWKEYPIQAPSPFHDESGKLVKCVYGHQCIPWEKKIILIGGKYSQYELQNKIWIFDTTTYIWNDITHVWFDQSPPVGRFSQAVAIYKHNYVDSNLLESEDSAQHDEFRFIVERKQMLLPNRVYPEVDVLIRRISDVFFFGGESNNQFFDELFRLSLRIEMLV